MFDDDRACGQLTILFDVASAFSSSTSASPYSEDRRFDELRNTSEIILITCMILSILLTRFTDCFLAFTAIKILVADFKTLFQYDYFRQQIADQLFIIVQLFLQPWASMHTSSRQMRLASYSQAKERQVSTFGFSLRIWGKNSFISTSRKKYLKLKQELASFGYLLFYKQVISYFVQ